jgi:hypothetical protein
VQQPAQPAAPCLMCVDLKAQLHMLQSAPQPLPIQPQIVHSPGPVGCISHAALLHRTTCSSKPREMHGCISRVLLLHVVRSLLHHAQIVHGSRPMHGRVP